MYICKKASQFALQACTVQKMLAHSGEAEALGTSQDRKGAKFMSVRSSAVGLLPIIWPAFHCPTPDCSYKGKGIPQRQKQSLQASSR